VRSNTAVSTHAPARDRLLRRILSSRQFAHADNLKRILRYLVERSEDSATPPPKEYEIAVHAMGRPASFDPRTDPIVRVSLGSIRDRLLAFFATEGRDEALRLDIPKGQYRVHFTEAASGRLHSHTGNSALGRFWEPYFNGTAPNVVVYTEPLFFRDGHGRYFRDWDINRIEEGLDQIRKSYPGLESAEVCPVFHYLSAGEMHCVLSITRLFHESHVAVETRNSRNTQWQELSQCNLVLLGSPRTNIFLESLQGEYPLVTKGSHIEQSKDRGACRFEGRRFLDGKLNRMTEYAVITRRRGLRTGSCVTMIAANHGRAIEGAGHVLTLEDRVQEIFDRMGIEAEEPLPRAFQLLMRVDTVDIDDEVAGVECESYYVVDDRSAR
jgi:hypothetical protein